MDATLLIETILTVLVRRGLTWLGLGAQVTEHNVTMIVGWLVIIGNEAWQAYKAHQAAKEKLALVKLP